MVAVTATELQNRTGAVIDQALVAPLQVTRNNRSVAVILSLKEYERLMSLEEVYWGQMADIAIKSDPAATEEVEMLLKTLV